MVSEEDKITYCQVGGIESAQVVLARVVKFMHKEY